jgi:transketolase
MDFDNIFLEKKASYIRKSILQTALWGGKGHIPPAFSWADIATVLFYSGVLKFNPANPKWEDRDRFILSKGHACLTLYAILADLNFFNKDELKLFAGEGSLLPGHPDTEIPGIEVCSGSLGHGLGVACGMAQSAKLDAKKWNTFVVLGDGECHEGSIWEAAMFAGHQKLGKLIAVVDRNMLGATDFTENYGTLEPLYDRFLSFGWDVVEVNGHDLLDLYRVFTASTERSFEQKPLCIIARTIKGKGISFMENSKFWHHQMPKGEQIEEAWRLLGGKIT